MNRRVLAMIEQSGNVLALWRMAGADRRRARGLLLNGPGAWPRSSRLYPAAHSHDGQARIERVGDDFRMTRIELDAQAEVPGIDPKAFGKQALAAKHGCRVSLYEAAFP